ncbi:xyloglucan galactosyltransferase KATAMARI1 homolog [Lolium perenne]|uniref:xyloglucan galactosyltransferase KATAMARI1 homolog n=1 Tax=Lolium perenne TaxID=4522 RepID=UPI003A9A40BE
MKPSTALSMEMDAANGKHSVGGGSGVGSLLRPPRIFCLTVLSIVFWALIIYFVSTMQGNMASLLLKPSAFSLPSFRFARDRCVGRYIYMYDLPPRFNADLVSHCRGFSVSDDICKLMVNDGFGAQLPPGESLPEKGSYDTDQYMLALIYHARMRRYECLTADPSTAAAVYVPFYPGFDVSLNMWKSNVSDRDALSRDLADWLVRQPQWRAM